MPGTPKQFQAVVLGATEPGQGWQQPLAGEGCCHTTWLLDECFPPALLLELMSPSLLSELRAPHSCAVFAPGTNLACYATATECPTQNITNLALLPQLIFLSAYLV